MHKRTFLGPEEGIYRTAEAYLEKVVQEKIIPMQGIRVYHYGRTAGEEQMLSVGVAGKLYQKGKEVQPEKALTTKGGWCFDGRHDGQIPESLLAEVLANEAVHGR